MVDPGGASHIGPGGVVPVGVCSEVSVNVQISNRNNVSWSPASSSVGGVPRKGRDTPAVAMMGKWCEE